MTSQTSHQEVNSCCTTPSYVGIGISLFVIVGISLHLSYNTIVSASDWFEYSLDTDNAEGKMATSNFVASLTTTLLVSVLSAYVHIMCLVSIII